MAETSSPALDPLTKRFITEASLPMLGTMISLFESSDDCVKIIGADGTLASMNCNGRTAMEIDDFHDVMGQEWASLWPDDARAQVRDALNRALAGEVTRFEAFCPTAKGAPRWWEVTVAPIADNQGAVHWALSSSRDISERVTREKQLETMALEMRHRLRNAFAASAGLVKAMARSRPEGREFADDAAQQLNHLAAVQASLLDFSDRIPLAVLLARLREGSFHQDAIATEGGDAVILTEPAAKALSMVIGELLSNSAKYGALATSGQVRIAVREDGDVVLIEWNEANGPDPADRVSMSSGQGSILKRRMMASIGGTLKTTVGDGTFTAELQFPRPLA